ncbi:MAG: Crp/Fnr family transcriptional regulator, partial [Caldimonas sp.]
MEAFLRASKWGRVLTAAQMDEVVSATTERSIDAGGFVARAGDAVRHWIGVVEGFVKMSVGSTHGKHSTLTGVPPGAWFGEGSLMKHERLRYDVIAIVDSKIALVPAKTFDWLRRSSFEFNHFLQDLLNARLSLFIGILTHDRLLDVDARVAHAVASLFDDALYGHPDHFLGLTQDEIGLLANVSRQRANGALRDLQARGLIRL